MLIAGLGSLGRWGAEAPGAEAHHSTRRALVGDYYVEVGGKEAPLSHAYQFCFREGVLASKVLSVGMVFAD